MTVEEILKILEKEVAPVSLSNDFCKKFDMYDNSGVIINCGKELSKILFSLDCSLAAVEKAAELGCDLIVTHHPAIYGGISRFDLTADPHARALAECIKRDISVISMHLNFDAAKGGIDENLMLGLGGDKAEILCSLEDGAYGRAYNVKPVEFNAFISCVEAEFNSKPLIHGAKSGSLKRVASFCGAGCDDAAVAFAKAQRVDVLVSSDIPHHRILELVENGIAVVQLKHYAAENYGFNKIYNKIQQKLRLPSHYFTDGRFV